ncbi:hypothetical protein BGZ75_001459, partial [Mortierella antarctica]
YHRPTAAREERKKGRTDIRVEYWELEGGHGEKEEEEGEDTSGQEDAVDTVQQLTIQSPFLEEDEEEEGEGQASTQAVTAGGSNGRAQGAIAGGSSAPDGKPRQINWKQRSKILNNVEDVYSRPEDCPPADDTIILGADPGEINALVVAKLDPRNGQQRQVVKVTRKFLSAPYVKFRRLLEAKKEATGVQDLESHIPPFSRATLAQYFKYMTGLVPTSTGASTTTSSPFIRKQLSWDSRRAQLSCLDLAIKGILRMAGQNESKKYDQTGRRIVLCIGLGTFNSQSGMPSKHSVLEARLVKKLKSLGYPVVGCHEYFTSAKCPRLGNPVESVFSRLQKI